MNSINRATAAQPAPLRLSVVQPVPFNSMGKEIGMEFWEQYNHPNWQKRRLERLQVAQWECENCGSADDKLHVHHKQYFKGRMIWEYSDEELEVLCEECHESRHVTNDELKSLLVSQHHHVERIIGYIHGLSALQGDPDTQIPVRSYEFAEGLADAFGQLGAVSVDWVVKVAVKNGRQVTARLLAPLVWKDSPADKVLTGSFKDE